MNELQVHELFRQIMHIGNEFTFSLKPFSLLKKLNTDELYKLLDSWEFKRFKSYCPELAFGIEEFYESRYETKLRSNKE